MSQSKMDVLDMIINILVEHEKTLEELIERIETALARQELLLVWR